MALTKGHVLLGGGTGFVGGALRQLLLSKNYKVTVISRMPGSQRVTWFDVCSGGLPDGVTAIINLAGQNILDPFQKWTPGFKQNVWNSRVNTTHTLAKAIQHSKRKPDVFITISGVGIYDPRKDILYDERSAAPNPFDFLSKLAVEWEKAGDLDEGQNGNVRRVIIRSGVVLGRTGGLIKSIYLPFFFCLGGPIGTGTQPFPWIHIKDLCNLFVFAIENSETRGVLNGVAPQIITNDEFTKIFASTLRRPAIFRIPQFLLNWMFCEERAKIMTMGQRVCPTKAQELGFHFEYPNILSAIRNISGLFYSKTKPF